MNSDSLKAEQQPQAEETHLTDFSVQTIRNKGLEALPLVDRVFVDEDVPEDIVQEIFSQLLQGEAIFVLFRLNSAYSFKNEPGKVERAPFWMVMTGTRLLLLAVPSEGQTYCDTFDQQALFEYQGGLARDELRIAGKTIVTGIWEGKRKLFKEVIHLFPLPEYEKYLALAEEHLNQEAYPQAIPLLQKSVELEPTIKGYLLLVHALARVGTLEKAFDILQQACQFAEPGAVFGELQIVFPENLVMFLYLAVVCEKNQWWNECIEIYQTLLRKTPDFDLYFFKLGEMYNFKQDYQTAITYYQQFIKLRTESGKFEEGDFINWDLSDSKTFAADQDLIKAFFDLGVIYETELHELEKAFSPYLALLRHAPFYIEAYQHFWQVYQQLRDRQPSFLQAHPIHLKAFWQAYKLLDPVGYTTMVLPAMSSPQNGNVPRAYRKMNESDHDSVTHPGEREYWRRIQNWITSLVLSDEEDHGIEQYCEQVGASNYPKLFQIIERMANFLTIDVPKCFISRGKIGISVRNKERPFIFIGSEHLNEENERYFSEAELLFVIATQAEHIKSGHILITGTELWRSLGTASFDGFLVALQYLPAGGFISKLTHRFALEGLKKVYKITKYSSIQKILKFVEKKVTDRNPEEPSEIEEEETGLQQDGRAKSKRQPEPESLLKEQLVDFARHAVYTADRVGLLACNDLGAACAAIFKLAGDAYDDLGKVSAEGLLHVLKKQDNRGNCLYFEYAKRFSELLKFVFSEEYWRIHEKIVVVSDDQIERTEPSPRYPAEHQNLLEKLQLLEQTRQKELLTAEEFLSKQKNLLTDSGLLPQEDEISIDKFQQACRDGVLTYKELQTKIFQLLETRIKGEG